MNAEIIKSAIQIIFLTAVFYFFYISLADNKSAQMAKSLVTCLIVYLASYVFEFDVIKKLIELLTLPIIVFFCVLYQPELRRAFAPGFAKRSGFFKSRGSKTTSEDIDSIIAACQSLIQAKRGALIVFPRQVPIKNIIESGTRLDADISTPLIVTVFEHNTALHDGAMIVQGDRIVAAGCYLPLSVQTGIKQSFGTRHRAGLGMAEESDAAVIIVSEETGSISLAYNANLYYNLAPEVVKSTLLAIFNNIDIQFDLLEDVYEK